MRKISVLAILTTQKALGTVTHRLAVLAQCGESIGREAESPCRALRALRPEVALAIEIAKRTQLFKPAEEWLARPIELHSFGLSLPTQWRGIQHLTVKLGQTRNSTKRERSTFWILRRAMTGSMAQ